MSPLSLSDILNSGLAITTNCMSFKTQMKPQVSVKVSFKFETLSTMMAGEWLLSRVNSHVSLKVYFNPLGTEVILGPLRCFDMS